jgi:hypothetical protein
MLRMDRCRRTLTLVWAVVQFALPALGTLAEAMSASGASAADAYGHVEEHSGPGCRPVHPPDCARCQGLSTQAAGASAPAVDWTQISKAGCPTSEDAGHESAAQPALPPARAPPLLS